MARRLARSNGSGARLLSVAAVLYAGGWLIHTADHLRRGVDVVTTEVLVLGSVAAVLQLIAIGPVLLNHRTGPLLALAVGLPDALGIAAVHLLPHWSVLSDSFLGAHGTGVNGLSWVAVIAEVASALLFSAAGAWVLRQRGGLGGLLAPAAG